MPDPMENTQQFITALAVLGIALVIVFGYGAFTSAKANTRTGTEMLTVTATATSGYPTGAPMLSYPITLSAHVALGASAKNDITIVPVVGFKGTQMRLDPFTIAAGESTAELPAEDTEITIETPVPPLDYGMQSSGIPQMVEGQSYKFGPGKNRINYVVTLTDVGKNRFLEGTAIDIVLKCKATFSVQCATDTQTSTALVPCDENPFDDKCNWQTRICGGEVKITIPHNSKIDCYEGTVQDVQVETTESSQIFDPGETLKLFFFRKTLCTDSIHGGDLVEQMKICSDDNGQSAYMGATEINFPSVLD